MLTFSSSSQRKKKIAFVPLLLCSLCLQQAAEPISGLKLKMFQPVGQQLGSAIGAAAGSAIGGNPVMATLLATGFHNQFSLQPDPSSLNP